MRRTELLIWLSYMLFLVGILFILNLVAGCDGGWSVGGLDLWA